MYVKDTKGTIVREGDLVKVLSFDVEGFSHLEPSELAEIKTLIGETLEVYEVDEYGRAWVSKEWDYGNGHIMSHSIALEPHEMEVSASRS